MKKINLITALLLAFVFVFTACEAIDNESGTSVSPSESGGAQTSVLPESEPEVSEPEVSEPEVSEPEVSEPEVSEPEVSEPEVSEPEVSEPEVSDYEQSDESQTPEVSTEEYVWYGIDEINDWFETYILDVADSEEDFLYDGKHRAYYFLIDGLLLTDYVNEKAGSRIYRDEYLKLFYETNDVNVPALCEYYGITKEEYVAHCNEFIEEFGKSKEGEIPISLMFRLPSFRYDTIFSEEYWNHSDYLLNDYVTPEIDDHYTSLDDRNGYTKRYYIIDRRLIEYVGVEQFEEWLDSASDTEQNIIEFIDHFSITREIYEDIYRKDCWQEATEHTVARWLFLPYNPDYIFGTTEMQEEYFTVHPLEK